MPRTKFHAAMAQLIEHVSGKDEVVSLILTRSTIYIWGYMSKAARVPCKQPETGSIPVTSTIYIHTSLPDSVIGSASPFGGEGCRFESDSGIHKENRPCPIL